MHDLYSLFALLSYQNIVQFASLTFILRRIPATRFCISESEGDVSDFRGHNMISPVVPGGLHRRTGTEISCGTQPRKNRADHERHRLQPRPVEIRQAGGRKPGSWSVGVGYKQRLTNPPTKAPSRSSGLRGGASLGIVMKNCLRNSRSICGSRGNCP